MKIIDIIAGARPNFVKIAPIIKAVESRRSIGGELHYRLVHTGQHYDARMSGDFFPQLGIPEPDRNLEVGSGSQAEQTASIMTRYERLLLEESSDLCLVFGDVTSTMACAITAKKLNVRVAHVEAGIRSGDWMMPEEINRIVTDAISDWHFTTSEIANDNLLKSGVDPERIFFVGNTMIDTLVANINRSTKPNFWDELNLKAGQYFVLTLHRPSNVDNESSLAAVLKIIANGARGLPVIFPVHPRTSKTLKLLKDVPNCIFLVDSQPYLEFIHLIKNAKAVITDSGGITEETTVMGVPCLTLRDSTERPETVSIGTNELVGSNPAAIVPALDRLFLGNWKKGSIPALWDGRTSERIVNILERLI